MKILISILVLLFSIPSFAQTETKEEFLNEVDTQIINKNSEHYYIYPIAVNMKYNSAWLISKLKTVIDDSSAKQIINAIMVDTAALEWNIGRLHYPKSINTMSMELKVLIGLNVSPISPAKQKEYVKKALKKFGDKPFNEQALYIISRPFYDNMKNISVLSISTHYNGDSESLTPNEQIYVFKKSNNRWKKYAEIKWQYGENVH